KWYACINKLCMFNFQKIYSKLPRASQSTVLQAPHRLMNPFKGSGICKLMNLPGSIEHGREQIVKPGWSEEKGRPGSQGFTIHRAPGNPQAYESLQGIRDLQAYESSRLDRAWKRTDCKARPLIN
ncbi:hypothetical protein KUV50_19265, partial [Membranicola marinus]